MLKFVAPHIAKCFQKYSEDDFHYRMANGFDFVLDWKLNHGTKYKKFMYVARKLRSRYNFDEYQIFDAVITLLKNRGWQLQATERSVIFEDILQIKEEIYL